MTDMDGGYVMGYGAKLDPHRIEKFFNGELGINDLPVFAQDVIEGGIARGVGPNVYRLIMHCLDNGLCTAAGRPLQ